MSEVPRNSEDSLRPLELLAPAGDFGCLEAAIDAGADSAFLGLTNLNARRRARNFTPQELVRAVQLAHGRSVRAYLTINIDLAECDIEQAAMAMELARRAGVDAVLVRDPAVLALRALFPELEFHFSTQTCMTSSADVAAAGQLGAKRAVLARELTLAEIAAASSVGVETEVFVQGALCFCISGRCLLSSWINGRSGNRGTCNSPCRLPWRIDERGLADTDKSTCPWHPDQGASTPARVGTTPLSMRDLAAVDRLGDLAKAGVRALKIEGRVKTAEWVAQAVRLYRRALAGEAPESLANEAARLGGNTGRRMTRGYLDGQRAELTELSRRQATERMRSGAEDSYALVAGEPDYGGYELSIDFVEQGLRCRCVFGGRATEWTVRGVVASRSRNAICIEQLFSMLAREPVGQCLLKQSRTNAGDLALMPQIVRQLHQRIETILRRTPRTAEMKLSEELPENVREFLRPGMPHPANTRRLGDEANRMRLEAPVAREWARMGHSCPVAEVILEGLTAETLDEAMAHWPGGRIVAALPGVFFEHQIEGVRRLLDRCVQRGVVVEVNSWGGWRLARQAGVRMEGGPGLGVLNSLAARELGRLGMQAVTLSVEADRVQLERMTTNCEVPCSLVIFARPALLLTRVDIPPDQLGRVFEDDRGVRLIPRREGGLCVFRPERPMDLRGQRNDRIRAAHLVVDLIGSPDPPREWNRLSDVPFTFNYARALA